MSGHLVRVSEGNIFRNLVSFLLISVILDFNRLKSTSLRSFCQFSLFSWTRITINNRRKQHNKDISGDLEIKFGDDLVNLSFKRCRNGEFGKAGDGDFAI